MHVFACSCTRAILLCLQPTVISQLILCNVNVRGEGGGSQCYIILGGLKYCYIVLYGGGGLSKNQHFCVIYYNMWTTPRQRRPMITPLAIGV